MYEGTEKDGGQILTVIAVCASVGRHGAVAGVVLPLLDADAHVGAGVLLARGAGAYGGKAKGMSHQDAGASELLGVMQGMGTSVPPCSLVSRATKPNDTLGGL